MQNTLRTISESEYSKIAKSNPDALNYIKIRDKNIIVEYFESWILIKNEYPYKNFLNKDVFQHYLIVSRDDSKQDIWEFSDLENHFLFAFLEKLGKKYPKSAVMYKNNNDKSIKKFHIHLIVF